jgi:hypothetical protein
LPIDARLAHKFLQVEWFADLQYRKGLEVGVFPPEKSQIFFLEELILTWPDRAS